MKCEHCEATAVISKPGLCKEHFIESFEARVKETLEKFDLLSKETKVCVAASGGKDSLTTAFILKKLGFSVSCLAIDEGIADYREHTLADLRLFCDQHNLPLKVVSFKSLVGKNLDLILKEQKLMPCTICGTFRRYLLNKHAHGFDVVATGHNADDEAQSILMNLLRANKFFTRPGPKTGSSAKGFVQRVKPLYFCTEKEIMTYSLLNNIKTTFGECPYVPQSYRELVRNELNDFAKEHFSVRQNILNRFLKMRMPVVGEPGICGECGEPTNSEVCAACKLIQICS